MTPTTHQNRTIPISTHSLPGLDYCLLVHVCVCLSFDMSTCLCTHEISVSDCLYACAHPHMLTHCWDEKEPSDFKPHQLDDVGNTEPVGWLDVLTSFHKALVALKAKMDG